MLFGGIDPGEMAGASIWDEDELLWFTQGEMEFVLRETIRYARALEQPHIVWGIEAPFVGKGPHASLEDAMKAGEARGWLRCAGLASNPWMAKPSSWRKYFGMNKKVVGDDGKKRNPNRKELKERAIVQASKLSGKILRNSQEHVAEAICIGRARCLRWREQTGS